eukprot:CAMPEP_0113444182 /NCGR_PEP_ID=MMETSP0014_2-20120614/2534_1 /TAXON_ID=2857 /ORGANISM="Nitzschia sp." /LENGTH=227 /DNA_ID=CAMNT_0000335185 /DNA_START=146 /DNA_END=826 /DNA_ORIENTATION=+ /assembly_acc=CAM_ASM_000159
MTRYNRLPQHYGDDYDDDDDADDYDDDEIDTDNPPAIVSITVTRHEKTDGSIVRVKQTLLSDGTSKRQEDAVVVPPRQSRPKTRSSFQQQKQMTNNATTTNNSKSNRTNSSFVDVRLWDHENYDDPKNSDDDDDDDGIVKFDFGGSRNDSLRIWPVSFLDEDEQGFNSLTTVIPLKYKLNQSSDSRTRVYLTVFGYILKYITIVALIVVLALFLKSIFVDELHSSGN